MNNHRDTGNHPTCWTSKLNENAVRGSAEAAGKRKKPQDKDERFEQIYRENKAKVMSTAYRLLGNRADAEDVTQDVFIKVYRHMDSFRGESAVTTWIYRITVNACYDLLRKRRREQTISLEDCAELSTESRSLKELIESMVAKLPEAYRSVFTLHDIQGLKHAEIAKVLGITVGTSKSLLHRARAQLRKKLSPYIKRWMSF